MMLIPASVSSPTMAQVFVVPMSSPTITFPFFPMGLSLAQVG
jgi:hypothetical protein